MCLKSLAGSISVHGNLEDDKILYREPSQQTPRIERYLTGFPPRHSRGSPILASKALSSLGGLAGSARA